MGRVRCSAFDPTVALSLLGKAKNSMLFMLCVQCEYSAVCVCVCVCVFEYMCKCKCKMCVFVCLCVHACVTMKFASNPF